MVRAPHGHNRICEYTEQTDQTHSAKEKAASTFVFCMSVSVFLVFLNNPPTPTPHTTNPLLNPPRPIPHPPRIHPTPPPHTPTTHHTPPSQPNHTHHHPTPHQLKISILFLVRCILFLVTCILPILFLVRCILPHVSCQQGQQATCILSNASCHMFFDSKASKPHVFECILSHVSRFLSDFFCNMFFVTLL